MDRADIPEPTWVAIPWHSGGRAFDPAEFITTPGDAVAYIRAMVEDCTDEELERALADIARSRAFDGED